MTSHGVRPPAVDGRRRSGSFWFGTALITVGVILHLPMYLSAADMGYRMAGMPTSPAMLLGMVMIIIGLAAAAYGLFPRRAAPESAALRVRALDEVRIGSAHIQLLLVMAVAVTIDVMKPTTLAFVVPGAAAEYGLKSPQNPAGHIPVALLPLLGITGTVLGAFLWGWLGDKIGRRASMLLAGVVFVATSICGSMPMFAMNLLMCFIMGLGAGGMLPIAFTIIAETMPARHRGWLMVLIGGDVAGAYIITSWLSSILVPTYSWRILWLLGLPTGLLLILLTRWTPESPRYLLSVGRDREAQAVMRRYGAVSTPVSRAEAAADDQVEGRFGQLLRRPFFGLTVVLALFGLGIGLVVYGFQLWLPSNLRHLGYNGATADRILSDSALAGFPLNFLVAYCYHRSTRWTMIGLSAAVFAALVGFVALGDNIADHKFWLFALLVVPIWGSSSILAVLGAYSAEAYPTRIRSRGSGLSSAMSKAGGVLVIALVTAAIAAPSIATTALIAAVPILLAAVAALFLLIETRQWQLEDITARELKLAVD